MKRIAATIQCVALLAAMLLPIQDSFANYSNDRAGGPEFVPGEVLIQFKAGVDESEVNRVLNRVNGVAAEKVQEALLHRQDRGELILARIPQMMSVNAARKAIEEEPTVEFAEPNWIYQHTATSNDTHYLNGNLWGMYSSSSTPSNVFGSQAAASWAAKGGDCGNVVVGIIDEGFMYSHTDLDGNSWVNPYDLADGVDNDGNGYVDDTRGWDFDGGNNSTFDGTTDDHGTHVAGTIGAEGGNAAGVAGMCWSGIKMISAKFLGRRGGTTANAVKAVNYFTDLKARHGLNIVATNNSWGGGGFSQALADAITAAGNRDILFIAAAGNSTYNCETQSCYPAEYGSSNVISVASITSTGAISSFSNYGSTTVDLGAPGSSIASTVPASSKGSIVSGYAMYSGTSMACPHVTGAAALYKARNPSATAAQIKAAILNSANPTSSLAGKTVTGGRLNVGGF